MIELERVFHFQDSPVSAILDSSDYKTIWHRLTHVCKILGFSNPNESLKLHCRKRYREIHTGRGRAAIYIQRSDVVRLTFASKKECAERFQDWVIDLIEEYWDKGGVISSQLTSPQAIALHSEIDRIVTPEKRPWSLHFDKDWQEQAMRLCGVTWSHPRMGQFINQTVYDFFPKKAIAAIKQLNANGQSEHTAHHQFLTKNFDETAYAQHLRDIYGYMLASPDLNIFWRLMEFRFKKTFQLDLFESYLPNQE
jgi:prophage antirepressor-like protein